MSTPAPHGATPTTLPGPRSGNAAFVAACARRDFALLQQAVSDMSKRDAVEHLAYLFPHRSERWFGRNLSALMALDPADFSRLLGYSDPTGDHAVARILERTAA